MAKVFTPKPHTPLPLGPYAPIWAGLQKYQQPVAPWPYGTDPLWSNVVYMNMYDQATVNESGRIPDQTGLNEAYFTGSNPGSLVNDVVNMPAIGTSSDRFMLGDDGDSHWAMNSRADAGPNCAICIEAFYDIRDTQTGGTGRGLQLWKQDTTIAWSFTSNGTNTQSNLYRYFDLAVSGAFTSGRPGPDQIGTFVHLCQIWDGTDHNVYMDGVRVGGRSATRPVLDDTSAFYSSAAGLYRGHRITMGHTRYDVAGFTAPTVAQGFGRGS